MPAAAKKKPAAKRKPAARRDNKATQNAKKQMWAVVLFALGILLGALTFIEGERLWLALHNFLFGLFGWSAYFFAPLIIYISIIAAMDKPLSSIKAKLWQVCVLIVVISGALQIFGPGMPPLESLPENISWLYRQGVEMSGGGVAGAAVGLPLLALFEKTGASITIVLLIFVFVMLITGSTLMGLLRAARKPVRDIEAAYAAKVAGKLERAPVPEPRNGSPKPARFNIDVDIDADSIIPSPVPESKSKQEPVQEPLPSHPVTSAASDRPGLELQDKPVEYIPATPEPKPEPDIPLPESARRAHPLEQDIENPKPEDPAIIDIVERFAAAPPRAVPEPEPEEDSRPKVVTLFPETVTPPAAIPAAQYTFPPLDLLRIGEEASSEDVTEELKNNAQTLVDTLKSFGVQTRIIDICRGPAVTRYELQPSAGVKISKITGLADDIALNLASAGIRIEAPIPNKAAVGIEVPNKIVSMVNIRDIIESPEYQGSQAGLAAALGRDIAGNIVLADIARMPHVLIAGSTGSGKSVCINSIIISILYKYSPEEVKLLMIDPKVVELGVYNGIPHLLVPVVTEPKKAAGALSWAVSEMMGRYKTFAAHSVKDLAGYNRLSETRDDLLPMPKIVVVIDELADLMMVAPGDVEDAICRLAQMARAAGMHLVIATQRPSVDVITGIIKANIPSRIAFAVSSQVDSRTILDMGGAEKLLGRGDMLFYPVGVSKPMRVQGCFVTEAEVESVVSFIKEREEDAAYDQNIVEEIDRHSTMTKGKGKSDSRADDDTLEGEDEMLPQAIECVVEAGQASTSQLQRRLKLGYARAARIIDQLEQKGVVGPFEGSKPRQVLISKERWMEMKLSGAEDAVLSGARAGNGDLPL